MVAGFFIYFSRCRLLVPRGFLQIGIILPHVCEWKFGFTFLQIESASYTGKVERLDDAYFNMVAGFFFCVVQPLYLAFFLSPHHDLSDFSPVGHIP